MKDWVCRKCGHEVTAKERPSPITWTDLHVCYFYEMTDLDKDLTDIANDVGAKLIIG